MTESAIAFECHVKPITCGAVQAAEFGSAPTFGALGKSPFSGRLLDGFSGAFSGKDPQFNKGSVTVSDIPQNDDGSGNEATKLNDISQQFTIDNLMAQNVDNSKPIVTDTGKNDRSSRAPNPYEKDGRIVLADGDRELIDSAISDVREQVALRKKMSNQNFELGIRIEGDWGGNLE